MGLQDLKNQLAAAEAEYSVEFQVAMNKPSLQECEAHLAPYSQKIQTLSSQVNLLNQDYKMVPIPDYGDHMPMQEFVECCNSGGFIDYDGGGNYATETECSNIGISPSDVTQGSYRRDFTHVVWYNR